MEQESNINSDSEEESEERTETAAEVLWQADLMTKQDFNPMKKPDDFITYCQGVEPSNTLRIPARTLKEGNLVPVEEVCRLIEGWGAYWIIKLLKAGVLPPEDAPEEVVPKWSRYLCNAAERLKKLFKIGGSELDQLIDTLGVKPTKKYNAKEMLEQWIANMDVISDISLCCSERPKGIEFLGIKDERGVDMADRSQVGNSSPAPVSYPGLLQSSLKVMSTGRGTRPPASSRRLIMLICVRESHILTE